MQLSFAEGSFFTGFSQPSQWLLLPQKVGSVSYPMASPAGILLRGEV